MVFRRRSVTEAVMSGKLATFSPPGKPWLGAVRERFPLTQWKSGVCGVCVCEREVVPPPPTHGRGGHGLSVWDSHSLTPPLRVRVCVRVR